MSKILEHTMLNNVTENSESKWIPTAGFRRFSIHIGGDDFLATIWGSNEPEKPSKGAQLGFPISEDTIYEVTAKLKWVRVTAIVFKGKCFAYMIGD